MSFSSRKLREGEEGSPWGSWNHRLLCHQGCSRTTGKPQPVGNNPGPLNQGWGSLQGRDPTSFTADRYRHYLPARDEYRCGPVTEEGTQVLGGQPGPWPPAGSGRTTALSHLLPAWPVCSLQSLHVLGGSPPLDTLPTWHPMFNPTHQGAPSSSRSGSPHLLEGGVTIPLRITGSAGLLCSLGPSTLCKQGPADRCPLHTDSAAQSLGQRWRGRRPPSKILTNYPLDF